MHQRVDGAALLGDEAAVTQLLGATPGAGELTLALAGAAKGGHVELCRRLLAAGAPANGVTGPHEATALMCAAGSGAHDVVALLLEHGAHSGEAEHHSGLIPNSIPGRSRTTFGA